MSASQTQDSGSRSGWEFREALADANWGAAILSVVFGLGAVGMAWITVQSEMQRLDAIAGSAPGGTGLIEAGGSSAGSLAGLLLFGVLTFFFGLAALIALMRALGLEAKDSALGLPQGSIRAFMALVLIMLFFLMAVFLYLDVARTGTDRRFNNVSQADYNQMLENGQVVAAFSRSAPIDADDPASETETRWDVVLRASRESSQIAEEIARQLVTVLGTLIVAIAAFYFGANSIEAAQRGASSNVG